MKRFMTPFISLLITTSTFALSFLNAMGGGTISYTAVACSTKDFHIWSVASTTNNSVTCRVSSANSASAPAVDTIDIMTDSSSFSLIVLGQQN